MTAIQTTVYPSIEELMPDVLLSRIPANLAKEIETRYLTLGEKYLTNQKHTDGRFINNMMNTSRNENMREEIVDSVFCALGWIFKCQVTNREIPDSLYVILNGLIEIYALLEAERARGTYS